MAEVAKYGDLLEGFIVQRKSSAMGSMERVPFADRYVNSCVVQQQCGRSPQVLRITFVSLDRVDLGSRVCAQ